MNELLVVVESETRPRERTVEFLQQAGFSVLPFESAADAFSAVAGNKAAPQLAVIAWDASGSMSGPEFLARLLQRKAEFPRIVISPEISLAVSIRAKQLGAVDLVRKPVDRERLVGAVRRALNDPRETDPLVAKLRGEIIGDSLPLIESVVQLTKAIHSQSSSLLLIGESGVGKEIFAQSFHREVCGGGGLEPVNLAGLSATLIESELFGHEKGAFTGASSRHRGAFERAGQGTLFLDEIGYLDLKLQPKLLRALEQREFLRVGGHERIDFDARLVCATSRNLARDVSSGGFRRDLYFRISQFEIRIPPLRDRKEDVKPLAEFFLDDGVALERETLEILRAYSFPGNVRELRDILEYAQRLCRGGRIVPGDLPGQIMQDRVDPEEDTSPIFWPERLLAIERYSEAVSKLEKEFGKEYLARKLADADQNKKEAAQRMGIDVKTLRQKLRDSGLGHLVRPTDGEPS